MTQLRRKRIAAGLPMYLVASRAGLQASRLSLLERGLVQPRLDEVARIERAIEELTQARDGLARAAAQLGWPLPV